MSPLLTQSGHRLPLPEHTTAYANEGISVILAGFVATKLMIAGVLNIDLGAVVTRFHSAGVSVAEIGESVGSKLVSVFDAAPDKQSPLCPNLFNVEPFGAELHFS